MKDKAFWTLLDKNPLFELRREMGFASDKPVAPLVLCFPSQGLKRQTPFLLCHVMHEQRRIDQTGKHRVATDIFVCRTALPE